MSPSGRTLLIRAALSLGLALVLSRFFPPRFSWWGVMVLFVFLLGMGYMAEIIRRRG